MRARRGPDGVRRPRDGEHLRRHPLRRRRRLDRGHRRRRVGVHRRRRGRALRAGARHRAGPRRPRRRQPGRDAPLGRADAALRARPPRRGGRARARRRRRPQAHARPPTRAGRPARPSSATPCSSCCAEDRVRPHDDGAAEAARGPRRAAAPRAAWSRPAACAPRARLRRRGGPPCSCCRASRAPRSRGNSSSRRLARPPAPSCVADLRGRGLSGPSADGAHALDAYADDAAALIDGLGLRRPVAARPLARRPHRRGARRAPARGGRSGACSSTRRSAGPGRAPYPTSREAFLGPARGGARRHHARGGRAPLAELAAPRARAARAVAAHVRRARGHGVAPAVRAARTSSRSGGACPAPLALMRGADSPVVTEEGARELAAGAARRHDRGGATAPAT